MVVGWYHSHPGFGCWLSGVDINTQQSFEALSERAVAVVVDPIQSVKGKVRMCDCRTVFDMLILMYICILHIDNMDLECIMDLMFITVLFFPLRLLLMPSD